MKKKKYLITSALPYANGPLHFGHLSGAYLPADIYARFRKLQGHTVKHISGSDEHGVAIMLNAKKVGQPYKEYVNGWHKEHRELFLAYQVEFDFFGQTSAEYHKEETLRWFHELHNKGFIETRQEEQLFCQDCKNHLPDRFVEGTCYVCGYLKARGDECPECGEWILPVKLKNPVCKICGSSKIVVVKTSQYYLLLSKYHGEFLKWFQGRKGHWRKTVWNYVESLCKESLTDRAITRDLDWGIDVPLPEAKGKKIYVWFDAPIGYVSNLKEHLRQIGSKEDYIKDWWKNDEVEIDHFIGKDNIIFHSIIFPVMGMASGFINPPNDVPANQFLNLEGKQFSKSSGWYVDAQKALDDFGADALRYYLISIFPESADSSFSWSQFGSRVNGELANNIGNLVQRCLKFFHKNWPEGLSGNYFTGLVDAPAGKKLKDAMGVYVGHLDKKQFRQGLESLMAIGQDANTYFSDRAPWAQVKTDMEGAKQTIAHSCLYVYVLGVLFAPYLPILSRKILENFASLKIKAEDMAMLFQADLSGTEKLFANGMKLPRDPEGLIPKIDDKVIAQLESELRLKNAN